MGKTKVQLPQDPIPIRGIEETLMNTLKFSGLDRHHLSELLKVVTDLGVKPVKAFPCGIPIPDGLGIDVSLDSKGLGTLVSRLSKIDRIDRLEIFPKGIPYPQIFDARIHIR